MQRKEFSVSDCTSSWTAATVVTHRRPVCPRMLPLASSKMTMRCGRLSGRTDRILTACPRSSARKSAGVRSRTGEPSRSVTETGKIRRWQPRSWPRSGCTRDMDHPNASPIQRRGIITGERITQTGKQDKSIKVEGASPLAEGRGALAARLELTRTG